MAPCDVGVSGPKPGNPLASIGDERCARGPGFELVEHGQGLVHQSLLDEEIDLLQVGQEGVIRSGWAGLARARVGVRFFLCVLRVPRCRRLLLVLLFGLGEDRSADVGGAIVLELVVVIFSRCGRAGAGRSRGGLGALDRPPGRRILRCRRRRTEALFRRFPRDPARACSTGKSSEPGALVLGGRRHASLRRMPRTSRARRADGFSSSALRA